VGFDGTNGNGAHVTTGGTWTNGSSRKFKDRLVALDQDEVFQKVLDLDIQGWYYKDTDEYHIGPFAEDFYAAFQTGLSNEYLAPSDLAAVAVISVQALDTKYNALEARVEANEDAIEELRGMVRDLQFQIAQ
jgi:phage shock protein A